MTQRTDTSAPKLKRVNLDALLELANRGWDDRSLVPKRILIMIVDELRNLRAALTPPVSAQSVEAVAVAWRYKFEGQPNSAWTVSSKKYTPCKGAIEQPLGVIATQPSAEGARDAKGDENAT